MRYYINIAVRTIINEEYFTFIKINLFTNLFLSFPHHNQMKLVECLEFNTKERIVEIV